MPVSKFYLIVVHPGEFELMTAVAIILTNTGDACRPAPAHVVLHPWRLSQASLALLLVLLLHLTRLVVSRCDTLWSCLVGWHVLNSAQMKAHATALLC